MQLGAMEILQKAAVLVFSVTLVMVVLSWANIFTNATVDLGLAHYAEIPPTWFPRWVTNCFPLPLNTVVNFGYIFSGCYWINFIMTAHRIRRVGSDKIFSFFIFNSMSVAYGFIQLYRILLQTRASAVLDQWYTLPFFMFVYVWAKMFGGQCSQKEFYALMIASVASYSLTFFTPVGFEIALVCHIALATFGAVRVYRQQGIGTKSFCLALTCCAGFVVIKLLDHWLADFHWIFKHISGHFISKVCDVLQIYYVNEFFFDMMLGKHDGSMAKSHH